MKRLDRRVAIVTGGGSGIGRAICKALASEGASIMVADIKEDSAKETCNQLTSFGGKYRSVRVDVRSENEVKHAVEETVSTFGRIDILCANAGVSTMNWAVDLTEEEWNYNMDVNAKGVFFCCKHVGKQMIRQGTGGKIVNTASMAGKIGVSVLAYYSASKFAVVDLTQALADEFAKYKINVNAVCPGFVNTSMQERELQWEAKLRGISPEAMKQKMIELTPLGRIEEPEDVAKLVVFLASDEAEFMTGQAINVTGGICKH